MIKKHFDLCLRPNSADTVLQSGHMSIDCILKIMPDNEFAQISKSYENFVQFIQLLLEIRHWRSKNMFETENFKKEALPCFF